MKKLIWATSCLIAVILFIPYIFGYIAKNRIYAHYNYLNDVMGQIIKIQIIGYNQGWLSSDAEIKINLKSVKLSSELGKKIYPYVTSEYQENATDEFSILITSKIIHGPIVVQNFTKNFQTVQLGIGFVHSTLDIPWNYQGKRFLDYAIGKKQLFQGNTSINLMGSLINYIELPSIRYINYDNGIITDWAGLKSISYNSNDFRKNRIEVQILPLHISNMAGNKLVDSSSLTITCNMTKKTDDQWDVDLNLQLGNLVISQNDKPYLYFFNMISENKKIIKTNQVDFDNYFYISKINLDNQDYGPFKAWFNIHGIDWPTLNMIIRDLNETNFFDRNITELKPFYLDTITNTLMMLNGASLELVFQSIINNGEFSMASDIDIANQVGELFYPLIIIKNSHGKFYAVISEKTIKFLLLKYNENILKQKIDDYSLLNHEEPNYENVTQYADQISDNQISSLIKNGWIVKKDDSYGADYELKGGILYNFDVELLNLIDQFTSLKN